MHREPEQRPTPGDASFAPLYPRPRSHRIFDWLSLGLVGGAVLLVGFAFHVTASPAVRLELAAATLLLIGGLLISLVLLHRDEKVESALRAALLDTEVSGHETRSELHTLGAGYQYLFKANPVPMWIFDLETLRFLEVNDAALSQYGYSRHQFLQMTVNDIRSPEESARLARALRGVGSGLEQAGSWHHLKKDGTQIDVEVTSHGIIWQGRNCRVVCAIDVTQRLLVERALTDTNLHLDALVRKRTTTLHKRTQQLRRRKRELEELNEELEAFSSAASHDLRTPLFVINTFTRMLEEQYGTILGSRGGEYLSKIQSGCGWMSSLIDSLLKLAHASRQPLKYDSVDLSGLAEEIAAGLRLKDTQRDVTVTIEPGLEVQGDAGLLRIALENLIGNAWKFTSKLTHARISVGREEQDGRPVFHVRDNGAGFDMNSAEDLFRTFRRLHTEEAFAGHGIGLSTVQRIIQRHAGRIWAEAEPGKGATFYFTLGGRKALKAVNQEGLPHAPDKRREGDRASA